MIEVLSDLEQLKEIHLNGEDIDPDDVLDDVAEDILQIFEQKQQYGRTDLKIYL